MTKISTKFYDEEYSVEANFEDASGSIRFEIDGESVEHGGLQVADVKHSGLAALRSLIEGNIAQNFDLEPTEDEIASAIENAIETE